MPLRLRIILLSVTVLLSSCFAEPLENLDTQEHESGLFKSSEDGMFDVSEFLSEQYGFMPVPTIITEPAIGYGAGLGLMFLHESFGSSAQRKSPPSISGVMLAATENGTKFAGAIHLGFWQEDTIRSTSFVGATDVNVNFYLGDLGVDMNIDGTLAYQELMFRIDKSDFFIGANYFYADIQSTRNKGELPQLDPLFEHDFLMAALAGIVQYDTRDTIFTPSKGLFVKASIRRFDEAFGGKENFWNYSAKALYFTPLDKKLVLGVRVEGEGVYASSEDRVPFFSNPFILMRGIPAMRYQGQKMLLSELQLRWEFENRWNLVLFGGGGKVFGDENVFDPVLGPIQKSTSLRDADFHPAGGLGFRYELARKFGLWGGLDFARSEDEDLAIYITVGSAWSGF